jgi:hypothetical protein
MMVCTNEAWITPPSVASAALWSTVATSSATQLRFFGGAPPDDGSPGDYACKVRSKNDGNGSIVIPSHPWSHSL